MYCPAGAGKTKQFVTLTQLGKRALDKKSTAWLKTVEGIVNERLEADGLIAAASKASFHQMVYGGVVVMRFEPGRWHEFDEKSATIKPSFKNIKLHGLMQDGLTGANKHSSAASIYRDLMTITRERF